MPSVETIYLLGEGGGVHQFDADKLDDRFLDRLARGDLRRVNKDGSPYVEPADEPKLTPKQQAQALAESLGLDTSGTKDEVEARIAEHQAKLTDLQKQAAELDLDTEGSVDELTERIAAKLAE